ncbi:hypothetical protein OE88DRAFT_1649086 [Heliocybe sulcata]|uniref:Uncharacterized protein n=1 Tax=Heliocybe sulcata TaxID=5364 RepID=A0A5C3MN57_9AGAM|nr:hypothetical protein OE88DRAFT_1649086 [Heliocybe sulcata]
MFSTLEFRHTFRPTIMAFADIASRIVALLTVAVILRLYQPSSTESSVLVSDHMGKIVPDPLNLYIIRTRGLVMRRQWYYSYAAFRPYVREPVDYANPTCSRAPSTFLGEPLDRPSTAMPRGLVAVAELEVVDCCTSGPYSTMKSNDIESS